MNFKEIITLVKITSSENEMGDIIETRVEVDVFANKLAINQSETYQANVSGLKPSKKFKMRAMDYDKQQRFIYNTSEYKIIRVYEPNDDFIELIGESLVI